MTNRKPLRRVGAWEILNEHPNGDARVKRIGDTEAPLFFGSPKHLRNPGVVGVSVEVPIGPTGSVPRVVGFVRFDRSSSAVWVSRWPRQRVADTSIEVIAADRQLVYRSPMAKAAYDPGTNGEAFVPASFTSFAVCFSTLGLSGSSTVVVDNPVTGSETPSSTDPDKAPPYELPRLSKPLRRCLAAMAETQFFNKPLPSRPQLAHRLGCTKQLLHHYLGALELKLELTDVEGNNSAGVAADRVRLVWDAVKSSDQPYEWINEIDAVDSPGQPYEWMSEVDS